MSAVHVARFEPAPEAYAALCACWNAMRPHWPREPAIWARVDRGNPPVRFVATRGGTVLGLAEITRCRTSAEPGAYEVAHVALDESDDEAPVSDALEAALAAEIPRLACRVLYAYVPDSLPAVLGRYEARGFHSVDRAAYSRLDLGRFDPAPFAGAAEAVAAAGIAIEDVPSLAARALDWERQLYDLHAALLPDVPVDGGMVAGSFEDFVRDLADPDRYVLPGTFVARDAGRLVGLSRVRWLRVPEQGAFFDLTGTLRTHRRRGIATALKLRAIAYAASQRVPWIATLNDVANPMLTLNEALGFERIHVQHTLKREG